MLALVWLAEPSLLPRAPALLPVLLAVAYLGVGWARGNAQPLIMALALGGCALAAYGCCGRRPDASVAPCNSHASSVGALRSRATSHSASSGWHTHAPWSGSDFSSTANT